MNPFFITASGTDIGKTLVTTSLCWQLRQAGKKVTALKPIISGYNAHSQETDTALILKSCGLSVSEEVAATISPWRYKAALAPNMAAALEGQSIDLNTLVTLCRDYAALSADVTLVEGVGGIMSPLNNSHTVLDWMSALGWPVILVAGTYVGSISHTLTALEVLNARHLPIRAVVLSESDKSAASLQDTATTLEKFIDHNVPIVKIPRLRVTQELWKAMPPISWICEHEQV
ncbi:MAG: dethiobiotin synthase [Rickettsiales bacterium]|nr:dethiobiotin synthase [Rickettsiales bacterium]